MMKNYIVFAVSFLILFTIFQFISGAVQTMMYQPNMNDAWGNWGHHMHGHYSNRINIGVRPPLIPIYLVAFISASIAYFISNKFPKQDNQGTSS